jgi:hypothetical protein
MLIDDFSDPGLVSKLGTRWRGVSGRVMGGLSEPSVTKTEKDGRPCLRLTGDVRLENNGGFIKATCDLADPDRVIDLSGYTGLCLSLRGNGERYCASLRTPDAARPWQSYRAEFWAGPDWRSITLPFKAFTPHRFTLPVDRASVTRLGLLAIGRAFRADLAVSEVSFYR